MVRIEEKQVIIRMLSVDGRNMTKAFFKQVPDTNTLDTVWGYVTFNECLWLVGIKNERLQKQELIGETELAMGRYDYTYSQWEHARKYEQLFIGA